MTTWQAVTALIFILQIVNSSLIWETSSTTPEVCHAGCFCEDFTTTTTTTTTTSTSTTADTTTTPSETSTTTSTTTTPGLFFQDSNSTSTTVSTTTTTDTTTIITTPQICHEMQKCVCRKPIEVEEDDSYEFEWHNFLYGKR